MFETDNFTHMKLVTTSSDGRDSFTLHLGTFTLYPLYFITLMSSCESLQKP